MAVSQTPRKAGPFDGDGITTDFPFGFKVTSAKDVKVIVYNEETQIEDVLSTGYSVKLNANQEGSPGGTVKLSSALAEGTVMAIVSNVASTQDMVLTNRGGFYPEAINNALDKVTMLIQQVEETVSQCLRVRATSAETPEEVAARLEANQEISRRFAEIATEASNLAESMANSCQVYAQRADESADRAARIADELAISGETLSQALKGYAQIARTLSDLTNPAEARLNLGLGSAAEKDATEFASPSDLRGLLSQEEADGRYIQATEANDLFVSKSYVDSNFIKDTTLDDYLPKSDATQFYLSKTEASTVYLKKAESSSFALKTDLNGFLTAEDVKDFATVGQIEGFLTESDADGRYIQTSEAESLFVSKSYIDSNFVTNEAVKDFVTADQVKGFLTETEADGKYLAKSASSTFALKSDISGLLSATTAASTYLSKSDASSTYATKVSLNGYATTASLNNYATTASLADYAKTSTLSDYAKTSALANYLPKSGSRGAVAGYQTVSVSSATSVSVTKATADDTCVSTSSAVTVTVANGDAGTAWSKNVAVSSGGLSVSLGDAWSWANGEEPELTAKGLLVLYWAGVFGVADFVSA